MYILNYQSSIVLLHRNLYSLFTAALQSIMPDLKGPAVIVQKRAKQGMDTTASIIHQHMITILTIHHICSNVINRFVRWRSHTYR